MHFVGASPAGDQMLADRRRQIVSRAPWKSPSDIKVAYRNASFTANNRVVFHIKGNDYRLVVLVRWLTHTPLTLEMIRCLVALLDLPADVLVKPYPLRQELLAA